MLAVDRGNEKIAHLFDPHNPAVLQTIKHTIDAAHQNGIWVGVCGEMAGNPVSALLLLGMGVDELSMNALSVLETKKAVRAVSFVDMRKLAEKALALETSRQINVFLHKELKKRKVLLSKI
jgi:phosphotransferase system enzyme I (PtsI)